MCLYLLSRIHDAIPTYLINWQTGICFRIIYNLWAGIAQSVYRLATDWTVQGSNPSGGRTNFRTLPDRHWGQPSLLYNGYRFSFPGVKRPGHGVDPPPISRAEVKERIERYLYAPGPQWPVVGWTLLYIMYGAWGGVVVKALRYYSDGPGIDYRWCHWKIQWHIPFDRTMALGSTQPLVKMSTRNMAGGKGGRCVRVTTSPPSRAECHEICERKPPGTLWATPGLSRDCFTFTFYVLSILSLIKKCLTWRRTENNVWVDMCLIAIYIYTLYSPSASCNAEYIRRDIKSDYVIREQYIVTHKIF